MKKISYMALFLALIMFVAAFGACGGDNEESAVSGAQSVPAGDVSGNGSGDTSEADVFMNEAKNWGGTVTVLTHNQRDFSTAIIPEKLNDEPINDAFFERNALIEERYGITLKLELCNDPGEGIDRVRRDFDSGMSEIDVISLPLTYIAPLGVEGLLYDYNSLGNGYLHLEKPWWDQAAIRDLTINGKLWFLAGDAIIEDDEATWAIYFNKDIVESRGLESPYEIVDKDKWTLDVFYQMAKEVATPDKTFDTSTTGTWGILAQSYDCYALMLGAGQPMVDNSGDQPEFRVTSQSNVSVFGEVIDMLLDDKTVGVADFFGDYTTSYPTKRQIFGNGKALFMPGMIQVVSNPELREANIHYGILPMPKANELQDDYTTSVSCYWCQVLSIPVGNVANLDKTCYALEAMAYYGKQIVTPEYYDRTLAYKRFIDQESADMLDLIFRNRTYDLSGIFDFGSVGGNGAGSLYFYTMLLTSKQTEIVSNWETHQFPYESALNDLIEAVNK